MHKNNHNQGRFLPSCDMNSILCYIFGIFVIVLLITEISYRYYETPLHRAVRIENYDEVVKEITRINANPREYYERKTLLHMLFDNHDRVNGLDDDDQFSWIPFDSNAISIMNILLKHGARLRQDEFFRLIRFSYFDETRLKLIIVCKDSNTDINMKNANGDTELHHTMERERIDLARFLIENGADTGIMNKQGLTPVKMLKDERFIKLFSVAGDE